jgi:O-antigen ligase
MSFWNILLLFIIILPTVHCRIDLGPFSFSLMEPFVLVTAFLLVGAYLFQRKSITISKTPFLYIFIALSVWTALMRPWSLNWQNGLSDIRDWLVPLLVFMILSILARNRWERWYSLLLIWTLFLAGFGIFQHFVNGARPFVTELAGYKTGFTVNPSDEGHLSLVSYAAGFSSHPNDYGLYMLGGLLLALGWVLSQKRYILPKIAILLPIGLSLYWSYSKSSILAALILLALFLLLWRVRPNKLLLAISSIIVLLGLYVLKYLLLSLPQALLSTLWWRVGLWNIALNLLSHQPNILIFGNGMDLFSQIAYYPQPHNLYIYILLQYGILGLLLVLTLLLLILIQGMKLYQAHWYRRDPRLLGLWLGVMSFFSVGLTESTFYGIENRAIFLILMAGFEGLLIERKWSYYQQLAKD